MRYIAEADFGSFVAEALENAICSEVIVGAYGNLYVGLGRVVMPAPIKRPHPRFEGKFVFAREAEPEYSIATYESQWNLQSGKCHLTDSTEVNDQLETALRSELVGQPARLWFLLDGTLGIEITFGDSVVLTITPDDCRQSHWAIQTASSYEVVSRADGRTYIIEEGEPDPLE